MISFRQLFELAMRADTNIKINREESNYFHAIITLSDGELFELFIHQGSLMVGALSLEEWEIVFQDKYGSTKSSQKGGKVALELFAALENVVGYFIKKYQPEAIRFSGASKSKQKLYKLLAKKISKHGYYQLKKSQVELIDDRPQPGTEIMVLNMHWKGMRIK
jgi:hypothetical protein